MAERDRRPGDRAGRGRPPRAPVARARLAPPAQARGPRHRLRHRQDLRPRPEGPRLPLRRRRPRRLPGRPDARLHAAGQAARLQPQDVHAHGPVPHPLGPGQRGPADVFEAGTVVDLEALAARGLVKNNANRDWPVKILAKGELDRALTVRAHAFSAAAEGEDRGGRRHGRDHRRGPEAGRIAGRDVLRRSSPRSGPPSFARSSLFTAFILRHLPLRIVHPGAGRQPGRRCRRPSTRAAARTS